MIIGISGKMQSGKDTAAVMLMGLAAADNVLFRVKRFAGPVKEIVSILTGIPLADLEKNSVKSSYLGEEWNNEQLMRLCGSINDAKMTVREMLQKVGTDCMRNHLHQNVWVNTLMKDYKPIGYRNASFPIFPDWMITDLRFPNELKAIKDRKGITIRINRKREIDPENEHASEFALDWVKDWDYVVENDGTLKDLELKIEDIWKNVTKQMPEYRNTLRQAS